MIENLYKWNKLTTSDIAFILTSKYHDKDVYKVYIPELVRMMNNEA